jgi:pyruvate/2-oxoglutarate dehydrogenase complex dihydrolipoamide acyltransferase (E2) component
MKVQIIAKVKISGKKPGEIFMERPRIARALVALGRAEYMTRDVVAEQPKTAEIAETVVEILISPATLTYAESLGVDVTKIVGSGSSGRILKRDIDAVLA